MDIKPQSYLHSTHRRAFAAILIAGLLTAGAGYGQTDKAKGEEMLRHARTDLAEANRLSEAAVAAEQRAQEDQAAATQKRDDAVKLQREAFTLIRDSKRMRAAELRARASELEVRLKSDKVQRANLAAQQNHISKIAGDYATAASNIRATAMKETNPSEKAELSQMADSLDKQAKGATADGLPLQNRIVALDPEIATLDREVTEYRQAADRFAPEEK
jgi:hypothetical protein